MNGSARSTTAPRTTKIPRTTEKNRLEAFSDGVFAIALTLLVLDLLPGQHAASIAELRKESPFYLAYLTSFFTTAAIWISHHELFRRLRTADVRVLVLNVGLLFSASLVPWPTSLVANALRSGTRIEQFAATAVYSAVMTLLALLWASLGVYVMRHRHLLLDPRAIRWVHGNTAASWGSAGLALLCLPLGLVSASASLVALLLPPLFFLARLWFDREDQTPDIDARG